MKAYHDSLEQVVPNGPTIFSHVLRAAMEIANRPWSPGSQNYSILLVLTDGAIHDYDDTVSL